MIPGIRLTTPIPNGILVRRPKGAPREGRVS